ncbi:MAG TPA: dTDP-4-dehydrorhamnose reductase [Acidimicrobiales bacterium]|nr:dTDP-4-dehydrorhamnose reductase [Acidimicrobiales bacterium]
MVGAAHRPVARGRGRLGQDPRTGHLSVRVLVTGAGGQVGREVTAVLDRKAADRKRGPALETVALDRSALDVSDRDSVLATVAAFEPDVVIHLAAYTHVDACETDQDRAFAVNALSARHLAEAGRLSGAHVCYVSTDYVFDGRSTEPYREWDATNPLSVYGRSKLGGEAESGPEATIVRTSWVCGDHGSNMVKTVLRLAAAPGSLRFVDDQRGSPSVASDLAGMIVRLSLARLPGVFHVTNQGTGTWYDVARSVVEWSGGDPARVEPVSTAEMPRPAPRPANSVLDNCALRLLGMDLLPDWHESMAALVARLTRA